MALPSHLDLLPLHPRMLAQLRLLVRLPWLDPSPPPWACKPLFPNHL